MIFDIFVSSFNLVFEYQGFQHYHHHIMFGDAKYGKERGEERLLACKTLEITIIAVPYWWQRDKESVAIILHNFRPDLVTDSPQGVVPFSYHSSK